MTSTRGYQKCTLKMETWTHVHIGSGRTIGRWDYFIKKEKAADGRQVNRLYMLDYSKLSQVAVTDPGFIDSMVREAEKGGGSSLNEFLRNHEQVRERIGSYPRGLPTELSNSPVKLTELRLFAGSPRCYLPGSSLKGVLRTAYIAAQVRSGEILLSRDRQEVQRSLAKGFELNSPDNQIFQHIVLRDSAFFKSTDMAVAGIKIFTGEKQRARGGPPRDGGKGRPPKQSQDTFCEVLLCETVFHMDILLRTGHLKGKPEQSIAYLLKSADKFYRRVWDEERHNRKKADGDASEVAQFYSSSECQPPEDKYLLRIGHGSGQMATSILVDYRDKYKYKNQYRTQADEPLRQGRVYGPQGPSQKRNRTPYPYTAKSAIAAGVDERQPLGWVVVDKNLEVRNVD